MIKQIEFNNNDSEVCEVGPEVNKVFLAEILGNSNNINRPKLLAEEGKLDSYNDTYD